MLLEDMIDLYRIGRKPTYTSTLALLQQFSGDTAAAHVTWQQVQTKVEQLRRGKGGEFFGYEDLASAYVGLGDKTKAFAIVKEGQLAPFSRTVG